MENITRIAAEKKSYNCLEDAKMKITLKAKLTVSEEHRRILDRMAFASTKLWNTANWDRRQKWEKTGKIPNYYEQENILRDNPWHKRLPHHSAQAVLQKLDQSYRLWFMLRKTDITARPPGFKPKESLSIITFKESAFRVEGNELRITIPQSVKEELGFKERFLVLPISADRKIAFMELQPIHSNALVQSSKEYSENVSGKPGNRQTSGTFGSALSKEVEQSCVLLTKRLRISQL